MSGIVKNTNFNLKKKAHLDARLEPVSTEATLPDPNSPFLFIPEGARIYVQDVKQDFQVQRDPLNPSNFIWVNVTAVDALTVGSINITSATTTLDLSIVTPPIATCHSVVINILSGTSANINTITNFPSNQNISFLTEAGKQIVFTHTDYDGAGTNVITMEDGFDFVLHGRTNGDESITLKKDTDKIVQVAATQFLKASDIVSLFASFAGLSIVDNLTTQDPNKALSANQGYVLNQVLNGKMNAFTLALNGHLAWAATNVLKATPFQYLRMSDTTFATAQASAITAGIDPNNYRVFSSVAEGAWVLGPTLDPNISGNWVRISEAIPPTTIKGLSMLVSTTLTSGATKFLNFDTTSIINAGYRAAGTGQVPDTDIITGFETSGGDDKCNIKLTAGVYLINLRVHTDLNSTITVNRSALFGDQTNPINGASTVVAKTISPASTPQTLELNFEVEVSPVTDPAILTFQVDNTTDTSNFDGTCLLNITKLRNSLDTLPA